MNVHGWQLHDPIREDHMEIVAELLEAAEYLVNNMICDVCGQHYEDEPLMESCLAIPLQTAIAKAKGQ